MKALLRSKGWPLEKIHSIARLHALCGEYKIKIRLSEEDVVFLDSIYRGGYPAEEGLLPLRIPTREDAFRAVGLAEKLFGAAKKSFKK